MRDPHISLPEALLLLAYVGIADTAGLALIFVGFDDFGILDIATLPVTQIYFRMKGVRANFDLVMGLLEILPYVGALPLKTIGVIGVIAMDWTSHSESQNSEIKVQNDNTKFKINEHANNS